MADRSIKVTFRANVADFKQQVGSATSAVEDLAKQGEETSKSTESTLKRLQKTAQSQKEAWSAVSTGLTAYGVAAGAAVGIAVKKFADFDESMSIVQADTQETAANMELLRAAAIQAGADTKYSATEAAGAIDALAKAGVSTSDILNGGLAGAMDLAAAGGLEVGDAAEIAATSMNQFGLKGKDMTHIADLLAASAGKAMGDVTDMAQAFKYVGPVAHQMGVSIEETAGTIAYLAQQGILGDQAGTSLRGMLSSLTSPSKIASKTMKELGIDVYDASGKFVGFRGVAEQLMTSMHGLTNAERDQRLGLIFGNEQITTARLLYAAGADEIDKWTASVDDSGYASRVAAQRMDNLKGDLEQLSGSIETAFITAGSGANDMLRTLVQGLNAAVDWFGSLPAPIQQGALWLGALTAAAAGTVGIGMKLITWASNASTTLGDLGITSERVGTAIGNVGTKLGRFATKAGAAALALTPVLAGLAQLSKIGDTPAASVDATRLALEKFYKASQDLSNIDGLFDGIGEDYKDLAGALEILLGSSIDSKMNRFGSSLANFTKMGWADQVQDARDQFEAIGEALAQMVDEGDAEKASAIFKQIAEAAKEQGYSVDDVTSLMPAYADALDRVAIEAEKTSGATSGTADATDDAASSITAMTQATQDAIEKVDEYVDSLSKAAGIAMNVDSAQAAWAQRTRDNIDALQKLSGYTDDAGKWVKGLGQAVNDSGDAWDLYTDAGQLANSTMEDNAKTAWDLVESLYAEQGANADLEGTMQSARDEFIKTATQMGLNQEAAEALADRYGLIPSTVRTDLLADTRDAQAAISSIKDQLANLPTKKTITVDVLQYYSSYGAQVYSGSGNGSGGHQDFSKHATGGAIHGRGTGTSDSILSWLSNGEHVVTDAEVRAAGGQAAVYALRAAIRRDGVAAVRRALGFSGYAGGGGVGYGPRTGEPKIMVSAPSFPSTMVLRVGEHEFTAYVDDRATSVAIDAVNSARG